MSIENLFADLSRIEEDARSLVASLNDAQANWQPEGGRRWSVTQNLQHLAKTNVIYVDSMRPALQRGKGSRSSGSEDLQSIPGWFGRWFIAVMEPPPRFRVKTRPIVQPPSSGAVREALEAFLASHDVVRRFARDAASRDLRAKFKSPFGPMRLRVGTGLLVLAAHDRRHLWQARQVLQAEGFPRA